MTIYNIMKELLNKYLKQKISNIYFKENYNNKYMNSTSNATKWSKINVKKTILLSQNFLKKIKNGEINYISLYPMWNEKEKKKLI